MGSTRIEVSMNHIRIQVWDGEDVDGSRRIHQGDGPIKFLMLGSKVNSRELHKFSGKAEPGSRIVVTRNQNHGNASPSKLGEGPRS
jgi:hypothetical protein